MRRPYQVFMRDTRSGYIKLDYVYDKAQTVGDRFPCVGYCGTERRIWKRRWARCCKAAPWRWSRQQISSGRRNTSRRKTASPSSRSLSGAASFRALAREIVYAQIGTGMEACDFDPRPYELDAHSVCYALCRRYGVPVEQPDFSGVVQQYGELEAPERLNMLRETCDLSKVLNRGIERALDLRQRSRAKNARADPVKPQQGRTARCILWALGFPLALWLAAALADAFSGGASLSRVLAVSPSA